MSSPKRARYEENVTSSNFQDDDESSDIIRNLMRMLKSGAGGSAIFEALDKVMDFEDNGGFVGGQCGKIFEEGELVYHCKQCATDPTCVLCAKCYRDVDHLDHDVTFYRSGAGTSLCLIQLQEYK